MRACLRWPTACKREHQHEPVECERGQQVRTSFKRSNICTVVAQSTHASVTEQGLAAIVKTRGNQDVHVILRGGTGGTNYSAEHVKAAAASIIKARPGHHPSIMIDCSREEPLFYALLGRFTKYVYH